MEGLESSNVSNCSVNNFTKEDLRSFHLARGIASALFSFVCGLIVLLVVCFRAVKTPLQRLFLYLTVSMMVYLALLAIGIEGYFDVLNKNKQLCQAVGASLQYAGSVQVLFTLGITVYIFYKVCHIHFYAIHTSPDIDREQRCLNRHRILFECGYIAFATISPLLVFWLPFLHALVPYGKNGLSCWIRQQSENCTDSSMGFWEQMLLWYIPYELVGACTVLLVMTTTAFLCMWMCRYRHTRWQIGNLVVKESLILLWALFTNVSVTTIELSMFVIRYRVELKSYALMMTYSLAVPITNGLIPVSFLVYLYSSKLGNITTTIKDCCPNRVSPSLSPQLHGNSTVECNTTGAVFDGLSSVSDPSITEFNPSRSITFSYS